MKILTHENLGTIRTVEINGEIWFVGRDVAAALEYPYPTQAVNRHVDRCDRQFHGVDTKTGNKQVITINKSGVNSLAEQSKSENRNVFINWIGLEPHPENEESDNKFSGNLPKIFENEQFGKIRALDIDGEPWFVGKDMAFALGYKDTKAALSDHVDPEDRTVIQKGQITSLEIPNRGLTIINESGMYSLVLSSKLPKAKEFKHWVTSDVIPSIRKHGAYMTPKTLEAAILNPDVMIQICTKLKEEMDKNRVLQPKADYYDELVDKKNLTNLRDTAKELNVPPQTFNEFLIQNKYLYRDKKRNLKPYQAKNDGLFEVKDFAYANGHMVGTQTFVTTTGKDRFRQLINDSRCSIKKSH